MAKWSAHDVISDPAEALLTLKGNPGTGKSVLIKAATQKAESPNLIVLHHYFDRAKDSKSSTFKSALDKFCTSLLYQLLTQLEPKPWSFLYEWRELLRFNPGMLPWNLTQLQDAIREIIVGHEKRGNVGVQIYIDALDECYNDISDVHPTQPLEVLQWISKLLKSAADANVDVRVCLSRQHLPAYDGLEPKSQTIIVEDYNRSAIETFVKTELQRVEDIGLRHLLRQKIMGRCTNDFLWATAVVQDVLASVDSSTQKQVLQLVEELPPTHEEMYQRLLFTRLERGNTLRLLQMVSAARQALTADQFRHALAFTQEFKYESITEWEESKEGIEQGEKFENYLRRESRGLIEVHHGPELDETGNSVRFIHGSISTFLRNRRSVVPDETSPWNQRCHLVLLEISLRALDLPGNESVAFVQYACENWIYHVRDCGDLLPEIKELPSFLNDCSKRKAKRIIGRQILALKQTNARQSHLLEAKESLLVLLATLGGNNLLQRHLTECEPCQQDCSTYSTRYRKALQNTIIGRFTDITMWLLEKHVDWDVDINALYEDKTLLYKACYFGQKEVVAFLLTQNADPLKRSLIGYEYPLHAAIELGQVDIVRLLLQHPSASAQFRLPRAAQKSKGYTPLHTAIKSRQPVRQKLAVLRLLLKNAPKGAGTLGLEDEAGVSVLALARQVGKDGGPGAEEIEDEIEDFDEDERNRGRRM
ncbi:hypothetical protein N0V83_001198 [Neocucurbitaria cava]|uniref:Nephrocystin 3-like N-terminal domain-containing protein n=1 Tax=Neocucurbitaria cava TaxID=798079 RepID=A0A9W8YF91_9PLEO|nr:hypothetical protein N0V83_001198 [Neocucurbitaria cava]